MKNFITMGLLALLGIGAAGCANKAVDKRENAFYQAQETTNNAKICLAAALESPAAKALSEKFILKGGFDAEKVHIDALASAEDGRNLSRFHNLIQPCRKIALEGYAKVHADYVNLLADFYLKADRLTLEVMKRVTTIGEANARFVELSSEFRSRWYAIFRENAVNPALAEQSEMQLRQAAVALDRLNHQQELLAAAAGPGSTRTSCAYRGTAINCTGN